MNKLSKMQNGFGVIIVVLAVAAIGLIGFVGWRIYEFNKPVASEEETTTSQNDAINNAADLDSANDDLNAQKIDTGLDTTDIDESLSN